MTRTLKLLLIALAILVVLTPLAFVLDLTVLVLPVMVMIAGLIFLSLSVWTTIASARRWRAGAVLNYLEQAVRLNLPLPRVVRALGEGDRGSFGRDMDQARQALERGESFAVVLAAVPQIPPRVIGLVSAAERVGRLPQVLARLMQQRRAAITRGIGFLPFYRTYPLILSLMIVSVTSMLMIFVMPKFEAIFKDFRIELPEVTRLTVAIARGAGPWMALLLAVVLIALILDAIVSRWRGASYGLVERPVDWIANRLPWIGTVRMNRALGDALDFTAEAIESGRPIDTSLTEAANAVANSRLREKIARWVELMTSGESVSDAARKADMPALVSGMIATTLYTPDLAEVFRFLGRYYTTRFSRTIIMLEAAAVPAIAIIMGAIVAWIAMAFFTPLIALIQTVSSPARF